MNTLIDKQIVVGITGGIAAYKAADLVRRLREAGAVVRVVMTRGAQEFITLLTMQAVSGNPVHTHLFDPNAEAAMGHIELARWADAVVIAPASANFMAQLAYGLAEDLLTTLCLATTAPLILAPAMNQQMWLNAATQQNLQTLLTRGVYICGPAEGSQACGEMGPGRMLEPLQIIDQLNNLFLPPLLNGKHVLITAGPTQESIDPVRYISNHSSGKMGYALAEAAVAAGAKVTLISGPVALQTPQRVTRIDVQSADEMLAAVQAHIKTCDIFIAVAAVADYRPVEQQSQKIKKQQPTFTLNLVTNPDILATVASLPKPPFTVGFAAETENIIAHAKTKLQNKKVNLVIVNQVGDGVGFGSDENAVTAIWSTGEQVFPRATKKQLAMQLIQCIAEHYSMLYAK